MVYRMGIPKIQKTKHQRNNHRDPKLDNVQTMGDFGSFSPTWGMFIKHIPQVDIQKEYQEDFKCQSGCVTPKIKYLPDITGLRHLKTQRLWQHSRSLHSFKTDRVLFLRVVIRQYLPTLNKYLSIMDICIQRENKVLSIGVLLSHLKADSMPIS